MGVWVVESVLDKVNMSLKDIDMIVVAGVFFDYLIFNQVSVIKNEMKEGRKYYLLVLDIDSICFFFVLAFYFCVWMLDGV